MAQRFVMWRISGKVQPQFGGALHIDLTPEALAENEPELRDALGGGRIVSHTIEYERANMGPGSWLITFVVDMP
ncbi:hypothetical protein [Nocardia blacklockiae]|uniref:hypothetical protein n=1 Tax=Nocardia blacklockiae TaxID=480036 RepID=UPI001892FDEB|nr:hypothetical protein [Nocardia blacklockiae]MBF6175532.1 hypothetical protein [Nocardia blacklockiae]